MDGSASPTDSITEYTKDSIGIDEIMEDFRPDAGKAEDTARNDSGEESQISKNLDFEAGGENSTEKVMLLSNLKYQNWTGN